MKFCLAPSVPIRSRTASNNEALKCWLVRLIGRVEVTFLPTFVRSGHQGNFDETVAEVTARSSGIARRELNVAAPSGDQLDLDDDFWSTWSKWLLYLGRWTCLRVQAPIAP